MAEWLESRFTGMFSSLVRIRPRAHDPEVAITAGEIPGWFPEEPPIGCSGAGWTQSQADAACRGEGIERWFARPLPTEPATEATYAGWSRAEPAIPPGRFVLFHPEQYALPGFPLAPLDEQALCHWTCCRTWPTGEPVWVPEEFVFLTPRRGVCQRHTFGFSTGLSCGGVRDSVLLRGVQEVIERDALVGGWWGTYPVEEWPEDHVRERLGPDLWRRLSRPNLTYRFYRIVTPYSAHVTLVSLAGDEREGWTFSVGSACRETRDASWRKSLLEAVQGRHCVRRLRAEWEGQGSRPLGVPTGFFEHALYYALHPEHLARTVLERGPRSPDPTDEEATEPLAELAQRLGAEQPILFRLLTPPFLSQGEDDWLVLRVVIPGLQPLHADHRFPFLGGPLWQGRPLREWEQIPPHPFA